MICQDLTSRFLMYFGSWFYADRDNDAVLGLFRHNPHHYSTVPSVAESKKAYA
jgi:hypothetical protein